MNINKLFPELERKDEGFDKMFEALIYTAQMFDSIMICPPYRETINGKKVIGAIESATGLTWPEIKKRIGGER